MSTHGSEPWDSERPRAGRLSPRLVGRGVVAKRSAIASPRFVTPMAGMLVESLPEGDDWLYEAKFDDYRATV
jgi:ATP-dependent DNA ligase